MQRSSIHFWLIAVACLVGCDGFTGSRGVVVDPGGEAVSGGEVALLHEMSHESLQAQTDQDGCYLFFTAVRPGSRRGIVVRAEGRKTFQGEIDVYERSKNMLIVTLPRTETATPARARRPSKADIEKHPACFRDDK